MPVPFAGSLEIAARGEREIVMTRMFDAPRALVFDAFTKPEFLRKWLLGPDGWSMPVCEVDLRAGGGYRFVWKRDSDGSTMGVGGVYRDVSAPERTVHTEKFDDAWYPGESVITTVFEEAAARTTTTMTILYESREARDGVLKSPMAGGVRQSYDRLAEILDTPQILRTAPFPIATIHVTALRSEIQNVMGLGLAELKAALVAQGVAVTGPWFTHHLRMDPGVFDLEIGVPVSTAVSPAGRVKPGTWPATRMVRTVHCGGYEGLGTAWGRFNEWVEARGLKPADDLWERYVKGPEASSDLAEYRTELNRPLAG